MDCAECLSLTLKRKVNFAVRMLNYGGGIVGVIGVAVSVGTGVCVDVDVIVGGADVNVGVNVEVGGCVFVGGRGVLVGAATTMETVSVDPNTVPVWVESCHDPVYAPGFFGATNATEI